MLEASTPVFKDVLPCCWGFILGSQSKSWVSGYGTQLPQVVCDVLPISNWKNILRISIILFLCGRIGELLITEEPSQLCPFPLWMHQAACQDLCSHPVHFWTGIVFPQFQMKEQSLVTPSERDFGSWSLTAFLVLWCLPFPCALAVLWHLLGRHWFSWPSRAGVPHYGAPQMHTDSCLPCPWLTGMSALQCSSMISRVGLSDFQTHWSCDVLCASWLHFKTQKCPFLFILLSWSTCAGIIQLWRILNSFQCSFSSCLHMAGIEKFLLFKHAGLCRETDFPEWRDYSLLCSDLFLVKGQSP